MTTTSQNEQSGKHELPPATGQDARNTLRHLYRKVGNRAVAAALSIQSSYTGLQSAKVLLAAATPVIRK
ncbi:MAG: hypothetical protein NWT00_02785 [Beijerinckiaceae bacterium]|jgi:hypothetical protein|nr:hypothetical protein [Beijerinckiaceae bacterium]